MADVSQPANAAQARRWNGPDGQQWVAQRERHLAQHQHLTPHLLRGAAIAPGERVLDIGCGCGDLTLAAAAGASSGHALGTNGGHALGLDLSAPMLQAARQLAALAAAASAGFVQADAQTAPLRPATFDVLISKFGTLFFDDPAAAFANLAAAVRPGGRLAILTWQDDEHNEMFAIPKRAFGAHAPGTGPVAGDLFADPPQITTLLSGTGWTDIQITPLTEPAWLGTDADDVMSYVRGTQAVRTLTASLPDPSQAEPILAALAGQYATRQHPDGVWVQAATFLSTARRP